MFAESFNQLGKTVPFYLFTFFVLKLSKPACLAGFEF